MTTADYSPKMAFWNAINEGRRAAGQPDALYGNVRDLWDQAMQPTQVEIKLALDIVKLHAEGHGVSA